MKFRWIAILLLLGLLFACNGSGTTTKEEAAAERNGNSIDSPSREKVPLTQPQKKEYVDRLLAFAEGRGPEDELIDVSWFHQRVRERAKLAPNEQLKEVRNILDRFEVSSIAREARRYVQGRGNLTFLRFAVRDGRSTALFRLIEQTGHFDYLEIALTISEEGDRVTGYDEFKHSKSDWLSDVQYQSFLFSQSEPNQAAIAMLLNDPTYDSKQFKQIKSFVLKYGDEKWLEAIDEFAALPESVRRIRTFLNMRHEAATKVDDRIAADSTLTELRRLPAIKASLADLRKFHPEEMITLMCDMEFHRILGNVDETMRLLDKIDSFIGGDPHLDVMRSMLLERDKQMPRAREYATKAIEREPTLVVSYLQAARLALQGGDFRSAVDVFRKAADSVGWTPEFVERWLNANDFEALKASPEFKAWKAESEPKK